MGLKDIYKFKNDRKEIPDADKLNRNFSHVNYVPWSLVSNGSFENSLDGTYPDEWTLSGDGAMAVAEDSIHGAKSVNISFGTSPTYIKQSAAEQKFLRGRSVKAWCYVKCNVPDAARIKINDGTGESVSAYHDGNGQWQLLYVIHPVAQSATDVRLELHVDSPGNALFDCAVLVDFEDSMGYTPSLKDALASSGEGGYAGLYDNNVFEGENTFGGKLTVTADSNVPHWIKFTIHAEDLAAPTTQNTINLCALAVGVILHGTKTICREQFMGDGVTSYQIALGDDKFINKYSNYWQVAREADSENYCLTQNLDAAKEDEESIVKVTALSNVSLDSTTSGTVDIYLLISNSF